MMSRVTQLDYKPAPTWEEARSRLLELRDGDTLSFEVEDDTWPIVLHIAELGYLVSGCGEGERDYFTLIERNLGDEPVSAFDGGDTRVFARYAFVTAPLLLKALEIYYFTGQRDRECEWVPAEDALYE